MNYEEENRGGQRCHCKNILCQEGFCTECQIYRDFLRNEGDMKGAYNLTLKDGEHIDVHVLQNQNWYLIEKCLRNLPTIIKDALQTGYRIEVERADIQKEF